MLQCKMSKLNEGVIAQLVERLDGIQKVVGSIPTGSTIVTFYHIYGY